MATVTPKALAQAFARLEACAIAGERCPTSQKTDPGYIDGQLTSALARDGKILIEIYAKNFRRVTILTGPHAGKTTANPPNPNWKPYLEVGRETRHLSRMARSAA